MVWKKLLLFSLLIVAAVSAGASTIVPVDLATMADRAELIFIGNVTAVENVPVRDGSFAFTYVTFEVRNTFKGIARGGKTMTLRIGGGQSSTDVYEVSAAPAFEVGGKHLLFVEGNDRLIVPLVGWFQGKLDVLKDPVSGQQILVDHTGSAVDGITSRGWQRNGMKLNKDGSLKQPEGIGAKVLSQQGVRIELQEPKFSDRAEPATKVLAQLRAYVNSRAKSSPKFKKSQFVDSASKANVPATFTMTAAPAPSVNGK